MSSTSRYKDHIIYQLAREGRSNEIARLMKDNPKIGYRRSKAISHLFTHILKTPISDIIPYIETLCTLIFIGRHPYRRVSSAIYVILDFLESPELGRLEQHWRWLAELKNLHPKFDFIISKNPVYKNRCVNTLVKSNFLHKDLIKLVGEML